MNEHKHFEDFKVFDNKGLVIWFKDGSHTYIDPDNVAQIIHDVIIVAFDELEDCIIPFPKEDYNKPYKTDN